MRLIVLDTETTGLSPDDHHRITEIGCVELDCLRQTGVVFHTYLNPEREVSFDAEKITGLRLDFLKDFPVFSEIADEFLNFIADSDLVIHNAAFDMKFLNAELKWAGRPTLPYSRAKDTLDIAKKKFPGSPASLDALCKRFGINRDSREKHGALIDAKLLAHVYIELMGGAQKNFHSVFLKPEKKGEQQDGLASLTSMIPGKQSVSFPKRVFSTHPQEVENHFKFIETLKNPLWHKFKKEHSA